MATYKIVYKEDNYYEKDEGFYHIYKKRWFGWERIGLSQTENGAREKIQDHHLVNTFKPRQRLIGIVKT